jgi:hypothetical protein
VAGAVLLSRGIVAFEGDRFQEMAFVDQRHGPTAPCDWLEWATHPEGYSYCWLAGTDPEPMLAPVDWTPQQSRDLVFHDYRDQPGRCLMLGLEEEHEVWLDFATGALFHAPRRDATPATPADAKEAEVTEAERDPAGDGAEGALLAIVCAALDANEYRYARHPNGAVTLAIRGTEAEYQMLLMTNDGLHYLRVQGSYGSRVPESRRPAVAEAIARIGFDLAHGGFALDFTDGELCFRWSVDVEGSRLGVQMVDNMIWFTVQSLERFHRPLMLVAFADADPATVLGEESA